jgi:hypothetical protein
MIIKELFMPFVTSHAYMTVSPNVPIIYTISHKNDVSSKCHLQFSSMIVIIFPIIMGDIFND